MIKGLMILILVGSSSAMAMDCINLSGSYKSERGNITFTQADCSKFTFEMTTPSGAQGSVTRITDGVTRVQEEDPSTGYFSYLSAINTPNGVFETWTYFSHGALQFFRLVLKPDAHGNIVVHSYSIAHQGAPEVDEGILLLTKTSD